MFILNEHRIRLCIFTSLECVLCCSMVASSTIRLWNTYEQLTQRMPVCNSQHFLFSFFLRRPLSLCIGFGFSCFVPHSFTCLLLVLLVVLLPPSLSPSPPPPLTPSLHPSFIHSFIEHSRYAHKHSLIHVVCNYIVHFPFLLCIRFLFPFPPLPKNLFTSFYFFFPCRHLTNIFHFGIFMCLHGEIFSHEYINIWSAQ